MGELIQSKLLWLSFLLLGACSKSQPGPNVISNTAAIDSVFSHASDTVAIDGTRIFIKAWVARDFMPTVPSRPEGGGLLTLVRLLAAGNGAIPPHLVFSKQYVADKGQLWIYQFTFSDYEAQSLMRLSSGLTQASTSNGPRWKPGDQVGVVVEVKDTVLGSRYLIRSAGQLIQVQL